MAYVRRLALAGTAGLFLLGAGLASPAFAQWGFARPDYGWQGIALREGAFGIISATSMDSADAARADLIRRCNANGWRCSIAEVTDEQCISMAYNEYTGYFTWVSGWESMSETLASKRCEEAGAQCDKVWKACGRQR